MTELHQNIKLSFIKRSNRFSGEPVVNWLLENETASQQYGRVS